MRRFKWLLPALFGVPLIALIVAAQPPLPPRGAKIAYSDLMAEATNGNVRHATITGRAVHGHLRDGGAITSHLPVAPDDLVDALLKTRTYVVGRPAEDDDNPVMNYILSWLPYVLWLLAFRYIGVRVIADREVAAKLAALEARFASLDAGPKPERPAS